MLRILFFSFRSLHVYNVIEITHQTIVKKMFFILLLTNFLNCICLVLFAEFWISSNYYLLIFCFSFWLKRSFFLRKCPKIYEEFFDGKNFQVCQGVRNEDTIIGSSLHLKISEIYWDFPIHPLKKSINQKSLWVKNSFDWLIISLQWN